jgi:serine/threonine-protein kinase RsbW
LFEHPPTKSPSILSVHVMTRRHDPPPPEGLISVYRGNAVGTRFLMADLVRERVEATRDAVPRLRRRIQRFIAERCSEDEHLLEVVGLAVTEACGNVVMHAYPPGEVGWIEMMAQYADGTMTITVLDDGVGLDTEVLSEGLGLGLTLIRQVAQAEIRPRPRGGTEVRMVIACQ